MRAGARGRIGVLAVGVRAAASFEGVSAAWIGIMAAATLAFVESVLPL